ncbi:hypothetical protein EGCR1_09015 [Enterococcus gilvus]|jgi:polyribonucleotide nucleotidyltransferase|nr:hypothetical protein EGCR1_09015 [Enterococcus gilvus]
MKINIEGSPKEIKELLQAIASSKEQKTNILLDMQQFISPHQDYLTKSQKSPQQKLPKKVTLSGGI